MKSITFSDSVSLANKFAVLLLAGLLNVASDEDTEDCTIIERNHMTKWFSTEVMKRLRVVLSGYQMSRLDATDSDLDPDSPCATSEIRTFTLLARYHNQGVEETIAKFDTYRAYLDGEHAEGWTRWKIKNVLVYIGDAIVELTEERISEDSLESVWGMHLSKD